MTQPPSILHDPSVCRQCASESTTCCTLTPGMEEFGSPVSTMERDRIYANVGKEMDVFTETPNTPEFLTHIQNMFPEDETSIAQLFTPDSTHFRLTTDAAGTCALLSETGCQVERALRPYYCQLFPFWYAGRSLCILVSSTCLAQQQYITKPLLLQEFDLSVQGVKQLYQELRQAWGLPGR